MKMRHLEYLSSELDRVHTTMFMGVYVGKRRFAYLKANAHMHAFVLSGEEYTISAYTVE